MITEEKSKMKLLSSDFQVFDPIFQSILISIFDLFFNTETRERWLHYGNIIPEFVMVDDYENWNTFWLSGWGMWLARS